jgi:hypothetical protein
MLQGQFLQLFHDAIGSEVNGWLNSDEKIDYLIACVERR